MALNKDIQNGQGVTVSYWKIGTVLRNTVMKFVDIVLYGYVSEDARFDNKDMVDMRALKVESDLYEQYFGFNVYTENGCNEVSQGYKAFKELDEEFSDAADC